METKYYIICVEQGIAWTMPKQVLCDKKGNERTIYAYRTTQQAEKVMNEYMASEKRIVDSINEKYPKEKWQECNYYFIDTRKHDFE